MPQEREEEEVLFDASKLSSGFGEGEAQTPPPQRPRSPEGGGVVHAAQPDERLPGLRTGPESPRGAPENKKRKSRKGGGSMRMNTPHFLVLQLPHVRPAWKEV